MKTASAPALPAKLGYTLFGFTCLLLISVMVAAIVLADDISSSIDRVSELPPLSQ